MSKKGRKMKEQAIKELNTKLHKFLINAKELENIPEKNDLLNLSEKLTEKIDNAVSKDGVLRIGVVGQVKAGKSSFINALLFDGKDILPKASTPMTAALTVIKYAKTLSAEVEFYSKADWQIIERNAKEFERAGGKTLRFGSASFLGGILSRRRIPRYYSYYRGFRTPL